MIKHRKLGVSTAFHTRRRLIILLISAGLLATVFLFTYTGGGGYRRFQTQGFGYFDSFIYFIGYAQNEADFIRYADMVFDRIGELHRLFDIFNPYENEGMRNLYYVNANAGIKPVTVDSVVIDMLTAGVDAYHITNGSVNIAMGSVLRIWHEYRQKGMTNLDNASVPSIDDLTNAARFARIQDLIICRESNTVFLQTPGMSLDVGSIAKGYAAELAMQTVVESGIQSALINMGGHIVAYGYPPGRNGWNVGIQNPNIDPEQPRTIDSLVITNSALSISGGYERFFMAGGQRFGHIIDPVTLMPADMHMQVAVLHPCSWMADIISTALFILPLEEGMQIALNTGAEAFWINAYGEWITRMDNKPG